MQIGLIRIADYFPEGNGLAEEIHNVCSPKEIREKTKEAYDAFLKEEAESGNHKPDRERSFYRADVDTGLIYYEDEPDTNHTEISGTVIDIPKEFVRIEVPTSAGTLDAEYCGNESDGIAIGFKPKGEEDCFVDVVLAEVKHKELCEGRDPAYCRYPTDKATPEDVCVYLYSDPHDDDWKDSFVLNSREVYKAINPEEGGSQ